MRNLRGPRVVLRPWRTDDVAECVTAIRESLDEIRPWLPFAPNYEGDPESAMIAGQEYIIHSRAQWILHENFNNALCDATDGRILGSIGLIVRSWRICSFEIGYWLRTSAVGHGYITEATRLLTDFAFDHLDACRVMIRMDAQNERSAAVPRRLGFVEEGLFRQSEPGTDGPRDMRHFSRVRGDPPWPDQNG